MSERKQSGFSARWILFWSVVITFCGAWGFVVWQRGGLEGKNLVLAKILTLTALPIGLYLMSLSIRQLVIRKK